MNNKNRMIYGRLDRLVIKFTKWKIPKETFIQFPWRFFLKKNKILRKQNWIYCMITNHWRHYRDLWIANTAKVFFYVLYFWRRRNFYIFYAFGNIFLWIFFICQYGNINHYFIFNYVIMIFMLNSFIFNIFLRQMSHRLFFLASDVSSSFRIPIRSVIEQMLLQIKRWRNREQKRTALVAKY